MKEAALVKSECVTLEHSYKERNKEILNEFLEDIGNLYRDFSKLRQMDNNEVAFLRQQLLGLNQEKTALQQNAVVLNQRVSHMEETVGHE